MPEKWSVTHHLLDTASASVAEMRKLLASAVDGCGGADACAVCLTAAVDTVFLSTLRVLLGVCQSGRARVSAGRPGPRVYGGADEGDQRAALSEIGGGDVSEGGGTGAARREGTERLQM